MEYEIKVYDWTWKFKQQIKSIYSSIEFQEELNGGQWNLNLEFDGSLDDYQCSDIIEIRASWIGNLYTWIIEEIKIKEFKDNSILSVTLYGVFTALNDIHYKSWWSKTFTKTDNLWNIIKNIIDSFNTDYGALFGDTQILQTNLLRYTGDSIDLWPSLSISFENQNCLEAIKKVLEDSWFDFFISREWIVYVKQKSSQPTRYLTFAREIQNIDRTLDKKDMVNKYYLSRVWNVEKTYSDVTAQNKFWLKEKQESKTDIQDETSQDTYGNQYIIDHKSEDNIVSIQTKKDLWALSLIPWNLISTNNSRNNLIEKQVTKIDIKKNYYVIYLWNFISFWKTILAKGR